MFTFEKFSTLIQLIPQITVSCGPFVSRGAAWRHLWGGTSLSTLARLWASPHRSDTCTATVKKMMMMMMMMMKMISIYIHIYISMISSDTNDTHDTTDTNHENSTEIVRRIV